VNELLPLAAAAAAAAAAAVAAPGVPGISLPKYRSIMTTCEQHKRYIHCEHQVSAGEGQGAGAHINILNNGIALTDTPTRSSSNISLSTMLARLHHPQHNTTQHITRKAA
jgi:hypothetical protein